MSIIGYARVSTTGQTVQAQIELLENAGVSRIYQEKISAKDANRPQLRKLLHAVRPGDVVIVTKLDRLARSTRDLLNIVHEVGEAGASFKSLGDPMWDTSTATGKLVAQILASVAEFERQLISDRTAAGRRRAQAAGVVFGRPRKITKAQRQEALQRLAAGETLDAVAKTYGVHYSSISRLKTQKLSIDEAIVAHGGNTFRRGH